MNTLKRILYEVGICVIGTYVYSLVSNQSFWKIQLPLWMWLTIFVVLTVLFYVVDYFITQYRVKRLITDFTECVFGDSYIHGNTKEHILVVIMLMDMRQLIYIPKYLYRR